MSTSSLWLMDENFNGVINGEYHNSWWFSPIVWDVLLDKYMRNEIQTPFGYKKSLIGNGGHELAIMLNNVINNCDNLSDRICWELSNQQIFFSKDKEVIAKGIKDFVSSNKDFYKDNEGISLLEREHIIERFNEIADDILSINEELYPNFVFKNTSVDDAVEFWFEYYDEEVDEYKSRSLKDLNKVVAEFVIIKNGNMDFITNVGYFKGV